MQNYEKHNHGEVDKVDYMLHLFDGWYDELDTKLRNTNKSSNGSHDIALASNKTNKLAITNKTFSCVRNKKTIEQEQLISLNYDNDDVTTIPKSCV